MDKRKRLILIIVIANLGFIWAFFNLFYYKKDSFDTSERANLNVNMINNIHNGDGSWTWNKNEYDFYKKYSISLDKNGISDLCKIVNSANAKYIENIRPKKWLDIYVEEANGNSITITLKQSYENEVYFEIDHKAFEGKDLEKYIQKHISKN
ncbi:MAG: hypothetical protein ABIP27_08280 [Flavobacterium circumlabens]|uniref:hypothetical protein n=1 Tax=Flavobacterium circumlabens TaxID=2133765 RepID=UPI0032646E3A